MPHVFNYETNEFEQIHQSKVPQRPTGGVKKRQRTAEAMKMLLQLEQEQTKKTETRAKRREALGK
eukprot:CAMPEP_0197645094 /NCGR_PEP_ID=MMETSP1338-20131121/17857_1 /TAXON_ID=43686 ORGANISM="Pelagodinium beii, Strain RCC1491" /NCGR_SAMPLE_ID=MMETSP1338 /ASSEMBLY_ACC=CAM_ASM_000754 /LENGTH=64 /DNA_ID=CAMNT_0043218591 /DNA_START=89 /DNA_END=283 /DNA_ORIENTATION=-